MKKNIVVFGSTGAIGQTVLDIARFYPHQFKVVGLSGNKNIALLKQQAAEFGVKHICVGQEGLEKLASLEEADIVAMAIPGIAALKPTLSAIQAKKEIALASKEIIVMAGDFILDLAKRNHVTLRPIDSELSAIMQSLTNGDHSEVEKIILTCSGGPFLGKKQQDLTDISPEKATSHPTWTMGKKISVDSATLMNKGFEVIEICRYFSFKPDKVEVVIHPQAILHSGVLYKDGSLINLMSLPDKHLQVQYALMYPKREELSIKKISLADLAILTFSKPDTNTFPCLRYAFDAINIGGTMPAVVAAADESAVNLFLERKIKFLDIPRLIKRTMDSHKIVDSPDIDKIIEVDAWARKEIMYGL